MRSPVPYRRCQPVSAVALASQPPKKTLLVVNNKANQSSESKPKRLFPSARHRAFGLLLEKISRVIGRMAKEHVSGRVAAHLA